MAAPKKAAKTRKKAAPAKAKASKTTSVRDRAARDPYRGPSAADVERSLDNGTSISLNDFRNIIKWA